MGCAPTTVSKWYTNSSQPPMETFVKVAELHGVRVNHYVRGYSSAGGSGAGILMVVVIFVGTIILLVGSSNSKKGEITSRSLSSYNPYHNLEERIRRQQNEDEDLEVPFLGIMDLWHLISDLYSKLFLLY